MKRHILILFFICSLLGMSSCIDEINLALEESNQAIVIDAWVGSVPGDTYVKVYRTSSYTSGVLNPSYAEVPLKSVILEQEDGEDIKFRKSDLTSYRQSLGFVPEPGKAYRLVLETEEGEIFQSDWETMPPRVEIEDIKAHAFQRQVMITSAQSIFSQIRTFADVQAQITDPGVGEIGYLMETSGITELYTSANVDNCACICYEDEPNIFAGMNVVSNSSFQGKNFGLSLGEIPLSYIGRYLVSTRLRVITKSNVDYLNQVDQQQRNSGSIFDPAPFRIKGNIKKLGAENSMVLGNFFLYQEVSFEKVLFRTQIRSESLTLNHVLEPIPFVNGSCLEYYTNASTFVPLPFRP